MRPVCNASVAGALALASLDEGGRIKRGARFLPTNTIGVWRTYLAKSFNTAGPTIVATLQRPQGSLGVRALTNRRASR